MEGSSYFDKEFDRVESEPDFFEPDTTDQQIAEAPVTLEEQSYLTSGHQTTSVQIGHHTVVLRTLKIGEEFEVALVSDKYKDTIEGNRSYITAAIAKSIVSVDGKPLVENPLGPQDETTEGRFNYVQNNFYWPVIEALYEEYMELMKGQQKVVNTLKKG